MDAEDVIQAGEIVAAAEVEPLFELTPQALAYLGENGSAAHG